MWSNATESAAFRRYKQFDSTLHSQKGRFDAECRLVLAVNENVEI